MLTFGFVPCQFQRKIDPGTSQYEGLLDLHRLYPIIFCCCKTTLWKWEAKNISISSVAIVACLASTMSSASDCEIFEEAKLCVSHLTNLLGRQPTEDEVVCQELCQSHTLCTHFTFVENKYPLKTGEPRLQCYLWKRCISKVTLIQLSRYWLDL